VWQRHRSKIGPLVTRAATRRTGARGAIAYNDQLALLAFLFLLLLLLALLLLLLATLLLLLAALLLLASLLLLVALLLLIALLFLILLSHDVVSVFLRAVLPRSAPIATSVPTVPMRQYRGTGGVGMFPRAKEEDENHLVALSVPLAQRLPADGENNFQGADVFTAAFERSRTSADKQARRRCICTHRVSLTNGDRI
jgi:hypothetical protein